MSVVILEKDFVAEGEIVIYKGRVWMPSKCIYIYSVSFVITYVVSFLRVYLLSSAIPYCIYFACATV